MTILMVPFHMIHTLVMTHIGNDRRLGGFTSFSTFLAVIQSYQEDGRVVMKGSVHSLGSDSINLTSSGA